MSDTNVVVLKGNLVRDTDLSYTNSGTPLLKGTVANNTGHKGADGWKEYTNYVDFTLWGKRAEALAEHLKKGSPVIITGSIHQSRWEQEGQKRSRIEIKVQDLSFAGKKPGGSGGDSPVSHDVSNDQGDGDFGGDDFPDGIPF